MSLRPPVTYSIVSGALPPGLTLDAGGFLSGVASVPGPYSFAIRATGSDGNFTQRDYSMTVIGIDNPSPLDDGFVSQPYAVALTQSGMSNPVWSVTDGSLPPGISLNPNTGVLSGSPTLTGDYVFTITIEE